MRRRAPVRNAIAAEDRLKNSMSMHTSIFRRLTSSKRRQQLRSIAQGDDVSTTKTFSTGINPSRSTMKRFSSKTMKKTLLRPKRSTARRIASYASTVEPCSATLRKSTLCGGASGSCRLASQAARRTIVRSPQTGPPNQRSIHSSKRVLVLIRLTEA